MHILIEFFVSLIGWLPFQRKHQNDDKTSPARVLIYVAVFCLAVALFLWLYSKSVAV